jgi:hypothetical protein
MMAAKTEEFVKAVRPERTGKDLARY